MTTNRTSRELFNLVKGMSKVEKKQFYQLASRNNTNDDLQIIAVYRALNNMSSYCSEALAKKVKNIEAKKLPGIKNSLYQLLLESLRRHNDNIAFQLSQLLDYATVLYQKQFYKQALKAIQRLKEEAQRYHQTNFLLLAVSLQKKIYILDDCRLDTIQALNTEMEYHTNALRLIGELSNAGLLLYGYYARYGTLRNQSDKVTMERLYETCLSLPRSSFYAQLYFHQAGTYFFLLNEKREEACAAAQAWVNLFEAFPQMKKMEALQYQRGMYFLNETDPFPPMDAMQERASDCFYGLAMQLNACIAHKTFEAGLLAAAASFIAQLPEAEQKILLCYKAALLCVTCGKYSQAEDFISTSLANKNAFRIDLQTALRRFQITIHERLQNIDLSESLTRSVRRFIRSNSFQGSNFQCAPKVTGVQ
ncbi:MAG: hypothetical protein ACTHLE_25830 [Agriterribacter sp.]